MDQNQRTTEEVLRHHLDVLGKGDVAETVTDYAPDALIVAPDEVVKGTEAIRKFFDNSVHHVLPPDSSFTLVKKIIEGELAYILWSAESVYYSIPFGTDTFIIREGRIHLQTFSGVLLKK